MSIKVLHVVGARPNYMKTAPIMAAMQQTPDHFQQTLVHTGQHYDTNMSDVFFDELRLPPPDFFLGVGSGTHAQQTARVMMAFEPIIEQVQPDIVLVVGDVNSTIACALVCAKLHVPVGHVEAGLRSFDRTMPEEINRILTDQLADLLFTPSRDGDHNLLREGIAPERIKFVGNVMIDTLIHMLPHAEAKWDGLRGDLKQEDGSYGLVTLHRPANVDEPERLRDLLTALHTLSAELGLQIVFPVHPRTQQRISALGLTVDQQCLHLIDPLGYLDFLALEGHAAVVVTDSGGVQEETSYLGVPCVTVRPNTERPITISEGTNRLAQPDSASLVQAVQQALRVAEERKQHPPCHIEGWDGQAAQRIAAHLAAWR